MTDISGRKEMVLAASAFMNDLGPGVARSVTLFFEDGHVATGKFRELHDDYFSFENDLNAGGPPGGVTIERWRREDHPYGMVKRIQRDHFAEYYDADR